MAKIKFESTTNGEFVLEFNTEKSIEGGYFSLYANNQRREVANVNFELQGHAILEAVPVATGGIWGAQGYSTSLLAEGASFENTERLLQSLDELLKVDNEGNGEKNKTELNWVKKYFLETYQKINSANNHFYVNAWAQSTCGHWAPFDVCLDDKTANIQMKFVFKVVKLITTNELVLLKTFFEETIRNGGIVSHSFYEQLPNGTYSENIVVN